MDKFCKFCGVMHVVATYPKKCESCGMETFVNPTPVAVLLLPVIFPLCSVGLLIGQRNIQPKLGEWGLIGGFVDMIDETIEHAAVRELQEETGIVVPVDDVRLVSSYNNGKNMMVFCAAQSPLSMQSVLNVFTPTSECSAIRAVLEPEELCFDSHTKAVANWFSKIR